VKCGGGRVRGTAVQGANGAESERRQATARRADADASKRGSGGSKKAAAAVAGDGGGGLDLKQSTVGGENGSRGANAGKTIQKPSPPIYRAQGGTGEPRPTVQIAPSDGHARPTDSPRTVTALNSV
jgi:hypothetical protein